MYGFRIIVKNIDDCYRTLGVVHNIYKPLPGRFKDYIAIPKTNGYQSLHTVLFGPYSMPIEVQIRTDEMDKVAEAGIAAHWLYKQPGSKTPNSQGKANEWLHGLLEMQKTTGNSIEFLENVKIDLFPDVVYVFTPKGEIMELPRGATPIDFAYNVHTDIGNTCVAAKVDRHLSPLRTQLDTGQTVEVITAPGARPNPAWLNFVVTGRARTHIRHYLKNMKDKEAVALGSRLLEKSLASFSLSLDRLPSSHIEQVVKNFKLKAFDDLLVEIGLGNRMPLLVAKQLASQTPQPEKPLQPKATGLTPFNFKGMFNRYAPAWLKREKEKPLPLSIRGTEGIVVTYAKCCRPIPGDPIVGIFSAGKGIVIHTTSCKNVHDFRKSPENILELQWESAMEGDFQVEIRVEVSNQRGVLAIVASVIADMDSNIENISLDDKDSGSTDLIFLINVNNRQHLAQIIRKIRLLDQVKKIVRTKG